MLINRTINRFRAQDWVALGSELIIVVVGIFIAIQVDSWWRHRDELQQEQLYIARLIEDVERDKTAINRAISLARVRLSLADLLINAAVDPEIVLRRPADFMAAVRQSSFTHTASLNTDTFEELRATGRLGLLRNDELKSALFEYYRYDENMRQYLRLQLAVEFKHFELAAGILTNEQYVWFQDEIGYVSPDTPSGIEFSTAQLDALVAAAQRLKAATDFVAWLPEGRSMQIELATTHEGRLQRARALLVILGNLR